MSKPDGYSSYYHDYFEGYYEKNTEDEKGKQHISRVYASYYFRHAIPDKNWIWLKIAYAALFLLSVSLFVYSCTRYEISNMLWYVQAFELVSTLAFFLMAYTVLMYSTAKRKTTIWEHKETSSRLVLFGTVAYCSLAGSYLASVIASAVNGVPVIKSAAGHLVLLLSGALVFAIVSIEKKMPYEKIEPSVKPPEGSIRIW